MSLSISAEDRLAGYALSFSYMGVVVANKPGNGTESSEKAAFNGMFAMNVLGYIPGVSLIVGIARIIFSQISALFNNEEALSPKNYGMTKAIQEAQLTRGILECTMVLEPLILIADIATTIFFACMADNN